MEWYIMNKDNWFKTKNNKLRCRNHKREDRKERVDKSVFLAHEGLPVVNGMSLWEVFRRRGCLSDRCKLLL